MKEKEQKDLATKLEDFLQTNKSSAILIFLGVAVLGIGVLSVNFFPSRDSQIEILTQENQEEGEDSSTIFVDLAGAVFKPGVYELESSSRINDLLITAGGLSAEADREWVDKNMNLAQKLADGVKIYIPEQGEAPRIRQNGGEVGQVAGSSVVGLININTASSAQLDTLWGVGPATAEKIISGRPYQSANELQTKKVVKSNVWEAIKDKITVY